MEEMLNEVVSSEDLKVNFKMLFTVIFLLKGSLTEAPFSLNLACKVISTLN